MIYKVNTISGSQQTGSWHDSHLVLSTFTLLHAVLSILQSCLTRQGIRLVGFGTGVGRGATGRLLSFTLLAGRALTFRVSARLTFARGTLTLLLAFALGRFVFAARLMLPLTARLTLPFVLPLPFALVSLAFLFRGRFGLFSFAFALLFALRFALVLLSSSGVTVSGDSPAFAGRLMSIATVCPVFTTSPARGSWNRTVSVCVSVLGRNARTRNLRSASPRIFSASKRFLPTTSGTVTSGLRSER